MVFVGLDMEGMQYFIIYFLILYLDGCYMFFGKVSKGMDVVYNIQVGDCILEVSLENIDKE